MKKFVIKENGTFRLPCGDFDRASFYLLGDLGDSAVVELSCYGTVFHCMEKEVPVIISMGRGAPLEIIVKDATNLSGDCSLVIHEVR
tara:strand:+ start:347 stop:607 length:261 start_codon:yes stop_codon:yes gene_type:complete